MSSSVSHCDEEELYFENSRWSFLKNRASGSLFLDTRGPGMLTVFLIATFTLAIAFHVAPPSTGQHIIGKYIPIRRAMAVDDTDY